MSSCTFRFILSVSLLISCLSISIYVSFSFFLPIYLSIFLSIYDIFLYLESPVELLLAGFEEGDVARRVDGVPAGGHAFYASVHG